MKVLVPVKRVVDHNVKIRVQNDGSQVDLSNAKMALNPFCEIAVEEAIRLKELGIASEIVVVTIGEEVAQEQLRSALAMGADRGLLIATPSSRTAQPGKAAGESGRTGAAVVNPDGETVHRWRQ